MSSNVWRPSTKVGEGRYFWRWHPEPTADEDSVVAFWGGSDE